MTYYANRPMSWIRAILFHVGLLPTTVFFGLLSVLVYPLPYRWRYRIITRWTHITLWWLTVTCGLDYRVSGREHIPAGPAIILCKHQSAWETMALQALFPPQVWVLKRELLWLPLLGWGLACLDPVAITRENPLRALQQVIRQGKARLQDGRWVVIFPEGTRVAPGDRQRYQPSGGMLAKQSGYPVVPVAHNAGLFWPRNSFTKRAGTIDIAIGPAIDPTGKTAKQITQLAEEWIEPTAARLIDPDAQPRPAASKPAEPKTPSTS